MSARHFWPLLAVVALASGCAVVKAPVKVAGSIVGHTVLAVTRADTTALYAPVQGAR